MRAVVIRDDVRPQQGAIGAIGVDNATRHEHDLGRAVAIDISDGWHAGVRARVGEHAPQRAIVGVDRETAITGTVLVELDLQDDLGSSIAVKVGDRHGSRFVKFLCARKGRLPSEHPLAIDPFEHITATDDLDLAITVEIGDHGRGLTHRQTVDGTRFVLPVGRRQNHFLDAAGGIDNERDLATPAFVLGFARGDAAACKPVDRSVSIAVIPIGVFLDQKAGENFHAARWGEPRQRGGCPTGKPPPRDVGGHRRGPDAGWHRQLFVKALGHPLHPSSAAHRMGGIGIDRDQAGRTPSRDATIAFRAHDQCDVIRTIDHAQGESRSEQIHPAVLAHRACGDIPALPEFLAGFPVEGNRRAEGVGDEVGAAVMIDVRSEGKPVVIGNQRPPQGFWHERGIVGDRAGRGVAERAVGAERGQRALVRIDELDRRKSGSVRAEVIQENAGGRIDRQGSAETHVVAVVTRQWAGHIADLYREALEIRQTRGIGGFDRHSIAAGRGRSTAPTQHVGSTQGGARRPRDQREHHRIAVRINGHQVALECGATLDDGVRLIDQLRRAVLRHHSHGKALAVAAALSIGDARGEGMDTHLGRSRRPVQELGWTKGGAHGLAVQAVRQGLGDVGRGANQRQA